MAHGYFVVRLDPTGRGLTTTLDGPVPRLATVVDTLKAGLRPDVPIFSADIADDMMAVLDDLGTGRDHVDERLDGGVVRPAAGHRSCRSP